MVAAVRTSDLVLELVLVLVCSNEAENWLLCVRRR